MKPVSLCLAIGMVMYAGAAQAQMACGTMENYCGFFGRGHTAPGPVGDWQMPHTACVECQIGDEFYDGEMCHKPCGYNLSNALHRQILEAAKTGDAGHLVQLAFLAPGYILVNLARQSVQVLNCRGDVLASLPFDPQLYTASPRMPQQNAYLATVDKRSVFATRLAWRAR